MPRQAKPWFRTDANSWYVKVHGKQTSLGVIGKESEANAMNAWHKLMANGKPKPTPTLSVSVKQIIDAFLADAEARVSLECLRNHRKHLHPFAYRFSSHVAEALTVAEVEAYPRKAEWSSSYRNGILGSIVSAYRWAERQRIISRSPLHGIRKPPKASRGAKSLIPTDTHEKLCRIASPMLRSFLQLLWLTGARPGEITSLTIADVDAKQGVAMLSEHKNAHLGKRRLIFLCPKALKIIQHLGKSVAERDQLFRGVTAKAFGLRLWRLCKKLKVKSCMAYGYRHTFASHALAKGIPDAHVAALLGHSSTAMLHKHYGHLTAYSQTLREALRGISKNPSRSV